MSIHLFLLVLNIIPIVIGILKYAILDTPYRILLYGICLSLINQIVFLLFKFSPILNNSINYLSFLILFQLRVYNCLLWSDIRLKARIIALLISASILLIASEVYWIGLDQYRASLALSIITLLGIIIIVYIIVELIKKRILKKTKQSIMLFMIPFVIVNIYAISIDIFLYFLYSKQTAEIFMNIYEVLLYLGAIGYLCFTLSLLLAPPKERFLFDI